MKRCSVFGTYFIWPCFVYMRGALIVVVFPASHKIASLCYAQLRLTLINWLLISVDISAQMIRFGFP